MSLLLRFLRRDTASSAFQWIIFSTAVVVIAVATRGEIRARAMLGAALLFAIAYTNNIWDAGQWSLSAIRRAYLQCLPVSRARMFAVSCFRSWFGWVPLLVVTAFVLPLYYEAVAVFTTLSLQLVFCNVFLATERMQKISTKGGRFLLFARWTFLDTVLTFVAIFSFLLPMPSFLLGLAYLVWQARTTRRNWLWD